MARARRHWTPEEDAELRRAVSTALAQSRPLLWRELAKSVPGRSNKDCRRRWWNILAAGTAKGPWSEEEDARLTEAVWKYGLTWTHVAQAVVTRNADQCSSHWSQVLDPSINHCDWTPTEDAQLLHAVLTHGTNWATIAASHIPKRTTLALKNRYSTLGLLNQNKSKKFKEQTDKKLSEKSPTSSLEANNVLASRRAPELDFRKIVDFPGFGNDKTVGGEEEEEDDEDDEDEGESGYSGVDDEENSAASLSQNIATNNHAHRRDTMNSTKSSGIWGDYLDRGGGGLALPPTSLPYNRMTPLIMPLPTPTPTGTWTPEATDQKSMFIASDHQSQPSFETIPGDYSSFVGNIYEAKTNMPPHSYQVDAIDIGFSKTTSAPGFCTFAHSSALFSGDMSPAPAPALTTTTTVSASSPDPKVCKGFQKTRDHPSITYQVTLDMVCTGTQIEAVMTSLEGVGASVSMKIEPRTSSGACQV